MELKPITRKQMRWQIAGQVFTLALTGLSIWISESIVKKALGGFLVAMLGTFLILAVAIFLIVKAIMAF